MGAELCDHRAQQPLVQATLYRQCQLCSHVSANLGSLCPHQATLVSMRVQVVGTAGLGEAGIQPALTPRAACVGQRQLEHFHLYEEVSFVIV